jgi:hypothetical protein
MRVAITSTAGYFGRGLLPLFEREPRIASVIGIDRAFPPEIDAHTKVKIPYRLIKVLFILLWRTRQPLIAPERIDLSRYSLVISNDKLKSDGASQTRQLRKLTSLCWGRRNLMKR